MINSKNLFNSINLKQVISLELTNLESLEEIYQRLIFILRDYKNNHNSKIGFVSGKVNSEGLENKQKNLKRLLIYSENLEKEYCFPVFSCSDITTVQMYERFAKNNIVYRDLLCFWERVIRAKIMTDIFMTPGWEKSKGAQNEHKTAKSCRLKIHYLKQ